MKKILLMTLISTMILSFVVGCSQNEDKSQEDISTKSGVETKL